MTSIERATYSFRAASLGSRLRVRKPCLRKRRVRKPCVRKRRVRNPCVRKAQAQPHNGSQHLTRGALTILLSILALAPLASSPAAAAGKRADYLALGARYDVTIRRDRWGVPHVYGKTDADAAFGLAYAQGEDAWPLMRGTLRFNRGTAAATAGRKAALTDYLVRALGFRERVRDGYDRELSAATRRYVEAFADGVNYYVAKHGSRADRRMLPITGQDIVLGFAVRHLLFFGLEGELKALTEAPAAPAVATPPQGSSEPVADEALTALPLATPRGLLVEGPGATGALPVGSNAIAVGPDKSSDAATRLAINSHQPTTGPLAWYEAHAKSDEGLDVMGGQFPGSPQISLGFNRHLAWGVTVNKPDLVDIYRLTLNPDNPLQYRLDDQWRDFEQREIRFRVKLFGPVRKTIKRRALYSVHGPVIETDHGSYAVRVAGLNEIRQVEQWLRMNKARSLEEWRDAMAMQSFASFNFVYADAPGNIYFVHNARMPVRLPGWDYSGVLPGDRSDLIWTEIEPFSALPQIENPASGFLHSANQTPFYVSGAADNPDPDDFARPQDYPSRITNRAVRGIELLEGMAEVSGAAFSALKHDKTYSPNYRGYRWLSQLFELDPVPAELREAVSLLKRWNRETTVDNREAALGVCLLSAEWLSEQAGQPAPPVVPVLRECVATLETATGRLDPPWGEVNRHVRGSVNVPVGGGPDTLRAIYGRGLKEDGYLTNLGGDGLYYLVTFDADGTLSVRGTHHFGSNPSDPDSPHFSDQAEAFAREELRSPLYFEAELEQNLTRSYRP
ncbi:MAG: acylase [Pseudomonadota bacterium]